ncbi:PREDICTED: phosphorylated adapter RNA export protein-like [Priapulus caudatus]|uniref:Phosphorylated adapter RNA export protein n=1 Tax=Priapulus caudatus TaxID=37621 RepID=A0ABM1EE26_PRICU|nr:PREDICTED: phosphorylated adapter RNA export protein-like [Priapulus caudatus]
MAAHVEMLEDGELSDSDDNQQISTSTATFVDPLRRRDVTSEAKPLSSGDSDTSSNDSDDDDGAGDRSWKRAKRGKPPPPAPQPPAPSPRAAANGFRGNGGGKPGRRRANAVWASVVQEQILSQGLTGFAMNADELSNDRAAESYDYITLNPNAKRKREDSSSSSAVTSDGEEGARDGEGGGRDGNGGAREGKEGARDGEGGGRDGNKGAREGEEGGRGRNRGVRARLGSRPRSVHSRLGSTVPVGAPIKHQVELCADDPPEKIVHELVYRLRESKAGLIARVVDTLGSVKTLELMAETEDVESAGGIMTLDGSRRRTPGGVFLQLMRAKSSVAKEQLNQIFEVEIEHDKKNKKRKKKRRHSHDAATQLPSQHGKEGQQPPGDEPMTSEHRPEMAGDDDAARDDEPRDVSTKPRDAEMLCEEDAVGGGASVDANESVGVADAPAKSSKPQLTELEEELQLESAATYDFP